MNSYTVWVVDDNILELKVAEKMFKKVGASSLLRTVPSGKECVDLLTCIRNEAEYPDLILLDLNMPELNGFDTLVQIRNLEKIPKHLKVIIFTNSDDIEDRSKAIKLGANDFISKPASPNDYATLLESLLE